MRSPSRCGNCRAEIQNPLARFCSIISAAAHWQPDLTGPLLRSGCLLSPLFSSDVLWPIRIRRRRERIRWLTEARGPHFADQSGAGA